MRYEEWTETRDAITLGPVHYLFEERLKTSDTRAPNNAYALLVECIEIEFCIFDSLGHRNECKLTETVVFAYLLTVEVVFPIVILNFTSYTRLKI